MSTMSSTKGVHYQLFNDHAQCIALSATYPVPRRVESELNDAQRRQPGTIETEMNYPCVSVYVPTSGSVLDTKRKQEEMKRRVGQIFAGLRRAAFFEAFRGIRLEIFDGRPNFVKRLGPGTPNGRCLRSIGEHYRQEREHRHSLQIARANLAVHDSNDFGSEFRKVWSQGTKRDIQRVRAQHHLSLERVCSSAGLVCPEVANFNAWRKEIRVKSLNPVRRRKTLSDLDPSRDPPQFGRKRRHTVPFAECQYQKRCHPKRPRRASVCGHYRADCKTNLVDMSGKNNSRAGPLVQTYIRHRFERLIKSVKSRFHAPIEPSTFAIPNFQLWSTLIVMLTPTNKLDNSVDVLLFDKDLSYEDITEGCAHYDSDLESLSATASINGSRWKSNSVDRMRNTPSLARVMGQFLFELGYCTDQDWDRVV